MTYSSSYTLRYEFFFLEGQNQTGNVSIFDEKKSKLLYKFMNVPQKDIDILYKQLKSIPVAYFCQEESLSIISAKPSEVVKNVPVQYKSWLGEQLLSEYDVLVSKELELGEPEEKKMFQELLVLINNTINCLATESSNLKFQTLRKFLEEHPKLIVKDALFQKAVSQFSIKTAPNNRIFDVTTIKNALNAMLKYIEATYPTIPDTLPEHLEDPPSDLTS